VSNADDVVTVTKMTKITPDLVQWIVAEDKVQQRMEDNGTARLRGRSTVRPARKELG